MTLGPRPQLRRLLLWVVVAGLGALIAFFGVTTVGIDGESMNPTVRDGERVLVPRYEYWCHRLGLRAWRSGEVVYFRAPGAAPRTLLERLTGGPFLIKRVVAVGGATIESRHGRLLVDGSAVAEPYLAGNGAGSASVPAQEVPPGYVYVLGDNRSPLASRDSRAFGPVPVSALAGRASWVVWPLLARDADGEWRWNVRRL